MTKIYYLDVCVEIVAFDNPYFDKSVYDKRSEYVEKVIDRWCNLSKILGWYNVSYNEFWHKESGDMQDVFYPAVEFTINTKHIELAFEHIYLCLSILDSYQKIFSAYKFDFSISET